MLLSKHVERFSGQPFAVFLELRLLVSEPRAYIETLVSRLLLERKLRLLLSTNCPLNITPSESEVAQSVDVAGLGGGGGGGGVGPGDGSLPPWKSLLGRGLVFLTWKSRVCSRCWPGTSMSTGRRTQLPMLLKRKDVPLWSQNMTFGVRLEVSRTRGRTEMATLTWDEITRKVTCREVSWKDSRFLRYLPMQAMLFLGQMPLKYFLTLMDKYML